MIVRALVLAGGVLGAASVSQFPEFSQQYTQRLGGAVDALGQVVADFDASAAAAGLDREAALYEAHAGELYAQLAREAGKAAPDAVAELSDAEEF